MVTSCLKTEVRKTKSISSILRGPQKSREKVSGLEHSKQVDLLLLQSSNVDVFVQHFKPKHWGMGDLLNIMRKFNNFSQSKQSVDEWLIAILWYTTFDFLHVIIKFYLRRKRWSWDCAFKAPR